MFSYRNHGVGIKTPSLVPEDFDLRFQRAFGLLAFSINRHILDHMRRIAGELGMNFEMAMIWGTLAHLNILPNLPLCADPMQLLDEMGLKKDAQLEPVRLSELAQITGLPRETVRRKLERLRELGKVDRVPGGKWVYLSSGIDQADREFTRKTVLQFLRTAESILHVLEQVESGTPNPHPPGLDAAE